MRQLAIAIVVLVACCGAGVASAQDAGRADPLLGTTPGGAIYHSGTCVAGNDRDNLVIFAPGTAFTPKDSTLFVRHLGDRTGRCVIAVAYENSKLVASYCTTTGSSSGLQDAGCLVRVLGAKAAAEPSVAIATDGTRLEVPYQRSLEGAILATLQHLGLRRYLARDGRAVRWDRLVLTGHSQGAQLAMFIALTRHKVAGVGSIGGGVLPTAGPSRYPRFVYQSRVTDPSRFKAFHHGNDEDAARREVYAPMGVPAANIRTVDVDTPECRQNPHSCVIVDRLVPNEKIPVLLEQWEWLASPAPSVR
jgi:pimeloyl-ACP methyl ester carboxylesterase